MSKYVWLLLLFVFIASALGGISHVKRESVRTVNRNVGNPFVGPGTSKTVVRG
ncbi:hypothetical protein AAVH_38637 [Aphelenchoides avenae]|nr:hypothetical protein AAVH_38637 [Aphelenchus avenae]